MDQNCLFMLKILIFDHVIRVLVPELVLNDRSKLFSGFDAYFSKFCNLRILYQKLFQIKFSKIILRSHEQNLQFQYNEIEL